MNWSAERYSRLYTRDTANWLAGPWQARALLPCVVRKLDRSGRLDLDDNGIDGLAAVVGLPVEVVEAGLAWWSRKGTLVMDGSVLVMPNFVAAQECHAAPSLRSKGYRDRRNVTPRDGPDTPRDATVTGNGGPSHGVTPSRTVPNQPERETREGAGGRASAGSHTRVSEVPIAVTAKPPRPTLAPTQRTIDPDLKLTDEARAMASIAGVQDIDGAWSKFVGHHVGKGTLSCDFIAGDWRKWIPGTLKYERDDRDKAARGGLLEPTEAIKLARAKASDEADAKRKAYDREAVLPPVDDLFRAIGGKR